MITKKCRGCKLNKLLSDFGKQAGYRDGYRATCRQCLSERQSQKGSEKVRAENLRSRYKITLQCYEAMLVKQGGGCAICGKTGKLCVDHCHKTKRVRGLLCHKCNVMIGYADEEPEILRRGIQYLSEQKP